MRSPILPMLLLGGVADVLTYARQSWQNDTAR